MQILYTVVWENGTNVTYTTEAEAIERMESIVSEWGDEDDHSYGGTDLDGNNVYIIESEQA